MVITLTRSRKIIMMIVPSEYTIGALDMHLTSNTAIIISPVWKENKYIIYC